MAFTLAQLAAIETAIGSGELTVSWEGKSVTYRSMADLLQARATITTALQATGELAADATPRRSYAIFHKG